MDVAAHKPAPYQIGTHLRSEGFPGAASSHNKLRYRTGTTSKLRSCKCCIITPSQMLLKLNPSLLSLGRLNEQMRSLVQPPILSRIRLSPDADAAFHALVIDAPVSAFYQLQPVLQHC